MFGRFFRITLANVREINKRYVKPEIEMSRWVKFALLSLRCYLILLVGLLLYKFISILRG